MSHFLNEMHREANCNVAADVGRSVAMGEDLMKYYNEQWPLQLCRYRPVAIIHSQNTCDISKLEA